MLKALIMKPLHEGSRCRRMRADRKIAIHGLTLIALGLSGLFLNSWDNLFVRASVGFFWGTFLLIVNWGGVIRAFHFFKYQNDRHRRSAESSTVGHQPGRGGSARWFLR